MAVGGFSSFERDAREARRSLRFLGLATGVAVVSLVMARGTGRLVWAGVLALCLLGLLVARRAFVRLAGRVSELPKSSRQLAWKLLRPGRLLAVRIDDHD